MNAFEFKKRKKNLLTEGRPALKKLKQEWTKLVRELPHRFMHGHHNENVLGDYIYDSKNAYQCFDVTHLEDCSYCIWLHDAKDCYDHFAFGRPAERCYECETAGDNAYNIKFSFDCWTNIANLEYCNLCIASRDSFGCIGLKRNQYCILNKQYSEQEYFKEVSKLREHMRKTTAKAGQAGEYGEFFPVALSPFAYNETVAQEDFPLTKEQARESGFAWKDEETRENVPSTYQIPPTIREVSDTVTNEILACSNCTKNFRIIPQELALYRTLDLPLPLKCFQCRLSDRKKLRNPRRLWDRICGKCGVPLKTSYASDRGEIIYCEDCYRSAVY